MREFTQSRGQFEGWRGKDTKRKKFIAQLISIIHRHLPEGFAGSVALGHWGEVNKRYMLAENGLRPYPLCGRSCVEQVYRWCDSHSYDRNQVKFIFERGDRDGGMLRDRILKDYGIKIEFEDKTSAALQAADLAAWELRKAQTITEVLAPKKVRSSLVALVRDLEWGRRQLENLCSELSIPPRTLTT